MADLTETEEASEEQGPRWAVLRPRIIAISADFERIFRFAAPVTKSEKLCCVRVPGECDAFQVAVI